MLTLIDGNSLLFRAYYGVRANLSRRDGTPVGAVYGFYTMILQNYLPDLSILKSLQIHHFQKIKTLITYRKCTNI